MKNIFVPALVFLLVSWLLLAEVAIAQTIPNIGNIPSGEFRTVTVTGLDTSKRYLWLERKLPGLLSKVYNECFTPTSNQKTFQLGPYTTGDGHYRVEVYESGLIGCQGKLKANRDFTVGTVTLAPGSGGPTVAACTPGGPQGIDTALGCIPTENLTEFVKWALRWAIGIGGGIAFLLILWSGFQIMTSSGNPDKLKAGQEQLTAAISGLLFLLFSVFLLRLIGLDILQLPGFGGP